MSVDCEGRAEKALKFNELNQDDKIERLKRELKITLRGIYNIGNKVMMMEQHRHDASGQVLIPLDKTNRVFRTDRSKFLD